MAPAVARQTRERIGVIILEYALHDVRGLLT